MTFWELKKGDILYSAELDYENILISFLEWTVIKVDTENDNGDEYKTIVISPSASTIGPWSFHFYESDRKAYSMKPEYIGVNEYGKKSPRFECIYLYWNEKTLKRFMKEKIMHIVDEKKKLLDNTKEQIGRYKDLLFWLR